MANFSKFYQVVDVVYSCWRPYDELWVDSDTRRWVSMADKTLDEMVDAVLAAINDQGTPKNILILFFQRYVGGVPVETMRKHIRRIIEATKDQKWNRVCLSTCWFVPSHQKIWGTVGMFNRMVHRANEEMGVSRVNIHRYVMSQVSDQDDTLRSRAAMWIEFQLGLHLGSHLSYEGVRNIINAVETVLDTAYKFQKHKRAKSRDTRQVVPQSLATTPGWNKNRFQRQLLFDRGLLTVNDRKPGAKKLKMSDQTLEGHENWYVFRKFGKLDRYHERDGILEAFIRLLKRADKIPDWSQMAINGNDEPEDEEETIVVQDVDDVETEVHVTEGEGETSALEEVTNAVEDMAVVAPNDEDTPYDPEEEWTSDRDLQIEITTKPDGSQDIITRRIQLIDSEDENKEMPLEKGTEKEREENSYEDLNELADKLQEAERRLQIEVEKNKAYKTELENKDVTLSKEKAATKFWRQQSEDKKAKIEELEIEVQRQSDEKKYMRNVYKSKLTKGQVVFK